MSLWRIHHYRLVRLFLVTAVLLALVACRINENNAVGELVSTQPATPPPQTISPTPTSLPTASPTHPPDPTSTPTAELTSTIQPTLTPTASPTLVQATPTLSPELAALRVVFVREQQLWLWQGGTAVALTAANDGQPADFYTSQIDGKDRELFYKGVGGFESWHPDSNRFLYWQGEQRDLFLGQVGSREPLFLTDLDIVSVAWIDSEHALYRSGENGNFALHIGVMAEPGVTLLVAEQVSNRWFDFSH